MKLFEEDSQENILPYDGIVQYYGSIIEQAKAFQYYEILLHDIAWKSDEAVMFGRHIITARKVAWYANADFAYTYSNTTKKALNWTKELLALRKIAENITGANFNSCLLNLYHQGKEGMAWHSDDEKSLCKNAAIASISFGAERKFSFKHKRTGKTISLILEHGSLLVMKDATQQNWMHRLPPSRKISTPRINLTFRTMAV